MRIRDIILNVMSLVLIGAGLALIATFFIGPSFLGVAPARETVEEEEFSVPVLAGRDGEAPTESAEAEPPEERANVPEDKTLTLTVPKMNQIQGVEIPTTVGTDEELLSSHAAIHLEGTGFPWEEEANVYIAGHRLGYPNTQSFLAFFDLDKLEEGDEVFLTDANGEEYVYRVFKKFVVNPTDVFVTRPIEGRNILTLQTCTLPDYSQRLIVQAEKVA